MKGVTQQDSSAFRVRSDFNPHTREGCDVEVAGRLLDVRISIHTPVKGVTLRHIWLRGAQGISIHTPVKGVTLLDALRALFSRISIHTPVKGVTLRSQIRVCRALDFNPHTREGCDGSREPDRVGALHISIHTPVKGVTFHIRV